MINIFGDWLKPVAPLNQYIKLKHFEFEEDISLRSEAQKQLTNLIYEHHTMTVIRSELFDVLGFPKVGQALKKDNRPRVLTTMKAHFGEILGCEFAKAQMGYEFPVFKLWYNPNPNQSMKGDDILGFQFAKEKFSKNLVLVGEAKYRNTFRNKVVLEAYSALAGDISRPAPISLEFIATILETRNERALATQVRQISNQLRDLDSEKVEKDNLLFIGTLGKPANPFLEIEKKPEVIKNLTAVNVSFHKTGESSSNFESFLQKIFQD